MRYILTNKRTSGILKLQKGSKENKAKEEVIDVKD